MNSNLSSVAFAAALLALPAAPPAAADLEYTIVIKEHRFEPAQLTVPAGTRVKLVIDNQDPTAEEFESHDLKREKVVPGNAKGIVWVGPLEPGSYAFVGEFHEDTARGTLTVK